MELPVSPHSYQPSTEALVRAIKRADRILARMAAEETEEDGFTAYTHPGRPAIHMCNFAAELRAPGDATADGLLDAIAAHFHRRGCRCFTLVANEMTWPDDLAAAAERRGYRPAPRRLYLLTDYRPPPRVNEQLQIIPGRAAYAELRDFHHARAVQTYDINDQDAADLAAAQIDHLDEPRRETFLGRLEGQPVGLVNLVTLGQIGVIDQMVTAADTRQRGVATTLLAHAMEHCRRALFEQVILETDPDNHAAARLYEQMGFTAAAEYCHYARHEKR